jgi:hypothetical protein
MQMHNVHTQYGQYNVHIYSLTITSIGKSKLIQPGEQGAYNVLKGQHIAQAKGDHLDRVQ